MRRPSARQTSAPGRVRVVLGIPGVQAWRSDWAQYGRGRVMYVGLDADKAGDGKAHALAADLYRCGATAVVRLRPSGEGDWTDAYRRGDTDERTEPILNTDDTMRNDTSVPANGAPESPLVAARGLQRPDLEGTCLSYPGLFKR